MQSSTGRSLPLIDPPKEDYMEKSQNVNSVSFHFRVQIFLVGFLLV